MKTKPITPEEYLANRIEAKPAIDLRNEHRIKAYQARCSKCRDDDHTLPKSIAVRAQQGMQIVLSMQLHEYYKMLRKKKLHVVSVPVVAASKKAASA